MVSHGTPKWFDTVAEQRIVPAGISGDFTARAERLYPRADSAELGRRAYFAELADRFENGAITPDEQKELVEFLSNEAAHNNN